MLTSQRKILIRPFFNCRELEDQYIRSVKARIEALEHQWTESYKPALHDSLVMELVRSEMMAFQYERLLANNQETELTPMLLRQERIQVGILREKLLISLDRVKKEEPSKPDESAPSLFHLIENAHEEDLEPEEPGEDGFKDIDDSEDI